MQLLLNKIVFFCWILPLFIFGGNTLGQKNAALINSSLTKPEKAIVYVGVENVITLFGNVPGKYIRMERTGGPLNIRPGVKLRAILKYTETGLDTIRVFDDNKLLLEKVYEIKKLGPYAIGLKGTRDSILTKDQLLKSAGLELYMPNDFYRPKQKISSYTITLFSPSGKAIQKIKVDDIYYADALQPHLDKIQPGAIILFSDLKAVISENNIKNFDPFKIKIK